MNHDTTGLPADAGQATLLLDLDGLAVSSSERTADGRVVRLRTMDETAAACPACGVISTRVKEYVTTWPRDLPQGRTRLRLAWRKRRWYCREPRCPRGSFTESLPTIPARSRLTTRLREHVGDLVVDGVCPTVAAAGRAGGVSWGTAMDAFRDRAEAVLDDEPALVEQLGIDEVRRGRPRWRPAQASSETPQEASSTPGVGPGTEPALPAPASDPLVPQGNPEPAESGSTARKARAPPAASGESRHARGDQDHEAEQHGPRARATAPVRHPRARGSHRLPVPI